MSNSVNSREISDAEYWAIITANNAQAQAMMENLLQYGRDMAEVNRAEMEKGFWFDQIAREQTSTAERAIQGFLQWQQTVNMDAENAKAARLGLEQPHSDNNWENYAENLKRQTERDHERMNRIGDVLDGEMPQEMQDAQDAMDAVEEGLPEDL